MSYLKMLSQFGASSAHPGGFSATLEQLQHFDISKDCKILEVGCGTGRTACLLSMNGYHVTACDIDPDMLKKAKKRAEAQELHIDFIEADVCSLPFKDNQFDIILAESVTNFADNHTALSEYYRVLKSGGTLYDREIVEIKPIPADMRTPLFDFFAFTQLASLDQWKLLLNSIKFNHVSSWDYSLLVLDNKDQVNHPDDFQFPDSHIFANLEALRTSIEYIDFINTYKEYLGSVVLMGSKP